MTGWNTMWLRSRWGMALWAALAVNMWALAGDEPKMVRLSDEAQATCTSLANSSPAKAVIVPGIKESVWRTSAEGFLEVDLGTSACVEKVVLTGVIEDRAARLVEFAVHVSEEPYLGGKPDVQGQLTLVRSNGSSGTFKLAEPKPAKYVRIQIEPYDAVHDEWHRDTGLQTVRLMDAMGNEIPIRSAWGTTGEAGGDAGDVARGQRWLSGVNGFVELELERASDVQEISLSSWWDWGAHAKGVRVWLSQSSLLDRQPTLTGTLAGTDVPQDFALAKPATGRYVTLVALRSAKIAKLVDPYYGVRKFEVYGRKIPTTQPASGATTQPR